MKRKRKDYEGDNDEENPPKRRKSIENLDKVISLYSTPENLRKGQILANQVSLCLQFNNFIRGEMKDGRNICGTKVYFNSKGRISGIACSEECKTCLYCPHAIATLLALQRRGDFFVSVSGYKDKLMKSTKEELVISIIRLLENSKDEDDLFASQNIENSTTDDSLNRTQGFFSFIPNHSKSISKIKNSSNQKHLEEFKQLEISKSSKKDDSSSSVMKNDELFSFLPVEEEEEYDENQHYVNTKCLQLELMRIMDNYKRGTVVGNIRGCERCTSGCYRCRSHGQRVLKTYEFSPISDYIEFILDFCKKLVTEMGDVSQAEKILIAIAENFVPEKWEKFAKDSKAMNQLTDEEKNRMDDNNHTDKEEIEEIRFELVESINRFFMWLLNNKFEGKNENMKVVVISDDKMRILKNKIKKNILKWVGEYSEKFGVSDGEELEAIFESTISICFPSELFNQILSGKIEKSVISSLYKNPYFSSSGEGDSEEEDSDDEDSGEDGEGEDSLKQQILGFAKGESFRMNRLRIRSILDLKKEKMEDEEKEEDNINNNNSNNMENNEKTASAANEENKEIEKNEDDEIVEFKEFEKYARIGRYAKIMGTRLFPIFVFSKCLQLFSDQEDDSENEEIKQDIDIDIGEKLANEVFKDSLFSCLDGIDDFEDLFTTFYLVYFIRTHILLKSTHQKTEERKDNFNRYSATLKKQLKAWFCGRIDLISKKKKLPMFGNFAQIPPSLWGPGIAASDSEFRLAGMASVMRGYGSSSDYGNAWKYRNKDIGFYNSQSLENLENIRKVILSPEGGLDPMEQGIQISIVDLAISNKEKERSTAKKNEKEIVQKKKLKKERDLAFFYVSEDVVNLNISVFKEISEHDKLIYFSKAELIDRKSSNLGDGGYESFSKFMKKLGNKMFEIYETLILESSLKQSILEIHISKSSILEFIVLMTRCLLHSKILKEIENSRSMKDEETEGEEEEEEENEKNEKKEQKQEPMENENDEVFGKMEFVVRSVVDCGNREFIFRFLDTLLMKKFEIHVDDGLLNSTNQYSKINIFSKVLQKYFSDILYQIICSLFIDDMISVVSGNFFNGNVSVWYEKFHVYEKYILILGAPLRKLFCACIFQLFSCSPDNFGSLTITKNKYVEIENLKKYVSEKKKNENYLNLFNRLESNQIQERIKNKLKTEYGNSGFNQRFMKFDNPAYYMQLYRFLFECVLKKTTLFKMSVNDHDHDILADDNDDVFINYELIISFLVLELLLSFNPPTAIGRASQVFAQEKKKISKCTTTIVDHLFSLFSKSEKTSEKNSNSSTNWIQVLIKRMFSNDVFQNNISLSLILMKYMEFEYRSRKSKIEEIRAPIKELEIEMNKLESNPVPENNPNHVKYILNKENIGMFLNSRKSSDEELSKELQFWRLSIDIVIDRIQKNYIDKVIIQTDQDLIQYIEACHRLSEIHLLFGNIQDFMKFKVEELAHDPDVDKIKEFTDEYEKHVVAQIHENETARKNDEKAANAIGGRLGRRLFTRMYVKESGNSKKFPLLLNKFQKYKRVKAYLEYGYLIAICLDVTGKLVKGALTGGNALFGKIINSTGYTGYNSSYRTGGQNAENRRDIWDVYYSQIRKNVSASQFKEIFYNPIRENFVKGITPESKTFHRLSNSSYSPVYSSWGGRRNNSSNNNPNDSCFDNFLNASSLIPFENVVYFLTYCGFSNSVKDILDDMDNKVIRKVNGNYIKKLNSWLEFVKDVYQECGLTKTEYKSFTDRYITKFCYSQAIWRSALKTNLTNKISGYTPKTAASLILQRKTREKLFLNQFESNKREVERSKIEIFGENYFKKYETKKVFSGHKLTSVLEIPAQVQNRNRAPVGVTARRNIASQGTGNIGRGALGRTTIPSRSSITPVRNVVSRNATTTQTGRSPIVIVIDDSDEET